VLARLSEPGSSGIFQFLLGFHLGFNSNSFGV
jgi:hypothetical protein